MVFTSLVFLEVLNRSVLLSVNFQEARARMGLGVLNPKHDEHVPGMKGFKVVE